MGPLASASRAELLAGDRRSGAARRLPADDTDGAGEGGRRGRCAGGAMPAEQASWCC